MIVCTSPQCQTAAGCVCQRPAPYVSGGDLRAAYRHCFRALDQMMLTGNWAAVGGALQILCSPPWIDVCVGCLRFVSGAKERVPGWADILGAARTILVAQGRDAGDELRGLAAAPPRSAAEEGTQ